MRDSRIPWRRTTIRWPDLAPRPHSRSSSATTDLTIAVPVRPQGHLVIDRSKAREAARRDGKWILITDDDTLSPEDAAQAYKCQLIIERSFRTLKSVQIEVRPMFHRLDRRIVAHVKVCVLALLLSRVAELATGQTWPRVRHELRQLQAIEYESDQVGYRPTSEEDRGNGEEEHHRYGGTGGLAPSAGRGRPLRVRTRGHPGGAAREAAADP